MANELPNPQSSVEEYLNYLATGEGDYPDPESRVEEYLRYIIENGGGGEGGTSNYNLLSNRPKINGTTLSGDKTSSDLGLYPDKPNGISKSDLSSSVQESLDKADSALQSHQDISGKLDSSNISHETWTFTLEDDTTVNKEVVLWVGT